MFFRYGVFRGENGDTEKYPLMESRYSPCLHNAYYFEEKFSRWYLKMSWSSSLVLNQEEHVVHSWKGIYNEPHTVHERTRRGRTIERKKTKQEGGVLVLTTKRLMWLEKRGLPFLSKSYHPVFEIYLKNLQGIGLGGTIFKYVTITDNVQQYQFNLKGVGSKEVEPFKDMILRQKERLGSAVLASSTVPHSMAKEVITREVVLIPCNYCQSLMPQTSVFCPNCGARRT